jgi:hypothetical protein
MSELTITLPEIDSPLIPTLTTGDTKMRQAAETPKISTLWLSFNHDDDGFLGVAIFDMTRDRNARLTVVEIVERSIDLGINPGPDSSVLFLDVTNNPLIMPEHKNRLILDEDLLLKLGRRPLFEANVHAQSPSSSASLSARV